MSGGGKQGSKATVSAAADLTQIASPELLEAVYASLVDHAARHPENPTSVQALLLDPDIQAILEADGLAGELPDAENAVLDCVKLMASQSAVDGASPAVEVKGDEIVICNPESFVDCAEWASRLVAKVREAKSAEE